MEKWAIIKKFTEVPFSQELNHNKVTVASMLSLHQRVLGQKCIYAQKSISETSIINFSKSNSIGIIDLNVGF